MNKGLKRNTIDKFYTTEENVNICIENIKKYININNNDLIIEPSAGNGAFIKNIKELSNEYLFYDIMPESNEIIKQDFLSVIPKDDKIIHIIGNPPFGRQSSLAIKFIKHCCKFAKTISFILPKSFKKESRKKYFDNYFHLMFEMDLDEFLLNSKKVIVPCVFQIWIKSNIERKIIKNVSTNEFKFVKKYEHPDISFRRVGVNAGKIDVIIDDKNILTHYFIKFTNDKTLEENLTFINSLKFEFNNTVGPKSISKQELIIKFNQRMS